MSEKKDLKQQILYAKLAQKIAADPLVRLQAIQSELDLRRELKNLKGAS